MRHQYKTWCVPLFIALSFGVAGATCLAAGSLASCSPLSVIGAVFLGGAAVGSPLLRVQMCNKPQCRPSDDSARQIHLAPRLSSRDLQIIQRSYRVSTGHHRFLAATILMLMTAVGTALLAVGALYPSRAALAFGVSLLVVGPAIGFSRMIIAGQCEVIAKLATMLHDNGIELSDSDAQTERHRR